MMQTVSHVCMTDIPFVIQPLILSISFSQVFRLLSGYKEHYLAAGLKLPVVLQYSPVEEGVYNSGELSVFVDDRLTISVPIEA